MLCGLPPLLAWVLGCLSAWLLGALCELTHCFCLAGWHACIGAYLRGKQPSAACLPAAQPSLTKCFINSNSL